MERVLALNKVHFLWNQGVFLRCLVALAKQHLPLSLSEVWCVEAQGAGGVGVSAVSAFLCCQVRCGHRWSGPQALRLPQAHRWFEFFSFMKYEVDFTISFLLSPFCFFLLLACFVILKQATFFFFLAVLPTFLLNRLKFTFLQAGVHGLPVRPGIYHTCSTFPCLLCAFCFVTLGFPCRSAICVWHHSGSWLQHPRESKGVYSAISQEAPWFPRPAHVHLLLSR